MSMFVCVFVRVHFDDELLFRQVGLRDLGEIGVPVHWHCFQVHRDSEW